MTRRGDSQGRVPRLAYLWLGRTGSDGETSAGLEAGLRKLGYREGRNIVVDWRYADSDEKRIDELAAAVVAERPDVIVTPGGSVTASVARLTKMIPIVSVNGDPVGLGFAASLGVERASRSRRCTTTKSPPRR